MSENITYVNKPLYLQLNLSKLRNTVEEYFLYQMNQRDKQHSVAWWFRELLPVVVMQLV